MMSIIETINIKKYYLRGVETVKALDGVDLVIKEKEIVSIVGPSGAGKTTLLNLISCLDSPTEGSIRIGNTDVTDLGESRLINVRRSNLGFIFQNFYLISTLTAKENIELPLIFSKKAIVRDKIAQVLKRVGLEGKENFRVNMLSGGDKQRIAIARALINDPKVIIADEPTGRLGTKERDPIMALFERLAQRGLAIVIATHDLELAHRAQRIIHLQDGRIIPRSESSLYY